MALSRRGAVAALCTAWFGRALGQSGEKTVAFTFELPVAPEQFYSTGSCKPVPGTTFMQCGQLTHPKPPYDYAIEVRFGTRVARLTGDEIMDALGAPK